MEAQLQQVQDAYRQLSHSSSSTIGGLQDRVRLLEEQLAVANSSSASAAQPAGPQGPVDPGWAVTSLQGTGGLAVRVARGGAGGSDSPSPSQQQRQQLLQHGEEDFSALTPLPPRELMSVSPTHRRLSAYAYDNGGTVSPRVSLQVPSSAQSSQVWTGRVDCFASH